MSLPSRERGLKCQQLIDMKKNLIVAPLAGAWIEMLYRGVVGALKDKVAPLAGAWIEMWYAKYKNTSQLVAPLAGAWIEILLIVQDVE